MSTYTQAQINWEENDFVPQIWIAVTATGRTVPARQGGKKSQQWTRMVSPDSAAPGRSYPTRDGKRQIYVISPGGGEAAQLTTEDNGVGALAWSPDGTSLAFSSSGPDEKAVKDRKDRYGEFDIVGGDYKMNHLWLVKVPTPKIPADLKQLPKPKTW